MQPAPYPFTAIVGQQAMRTALVANAVDSSLGGVLIRGHKGTGKSTAARALAHLLPSIEVVEGCPFHCHPDAPSARHEACCRQLAETGGLPRARVPTPMVELPLGATEDRLLGTLHVEHALRTGERRFEAGLLAAAHRGILYVDEVNLLDDHLVDVLLDAAASGFNIVEREGISCGHPASFMLIGTMNPEEGELRPQFLDRFGLCVAVQGLERAEERERVVRRRIAFEGDPSVFREQWDESERALAATIAQARARLDQVQLPEAMITQAVRLALAAKAHGHRADIGIIKTARVLAALLGKPAVQQCDLAEAARYVLPHRLQADPLATPEAVQQQLDQLLADVLEGAPRPAPAAPADQDEWAWAESVQVPGASAAGSILFSEESSRGKKKLRSNGSSTPTS